MWRGNGSRIGASMTTHTPHPAARSSLAVPGSLGAPIAPGVLSAPTGCSVAGPLSAFEVKSLSSSLDYPTAAVVGDFRGINWARIYPTPYPLGNPAAFGHGKPASQEQQ